MPHDLERNGPSLIQLRNCGALPDRRGWFKVELDQVNPVRGGTLFLDLGMGFNRHHSISLVSGQGVYFVRVPRPVRRVAVSESCCKDSAAIRFTRIASVRSIAEWGADRLAVVIAATSTSFRPFHDRLAMRWGFSGLRAIPVGERRFPARGVYALWRERFPDLAPEAPLVPGLVELGAEDLDASGLNALIQDDKVEWIGLSCNNAAVQPDAFRRLVESARNAGACVAYADNDHVDSRGSHFDPHLRTAFSPERLLSEDWLGPLLLISAAAARRAGGWRQDAGQALHYDLSLRILATTGGSGFVHVPALLASLPARVQATTADTESVRAQAIKARGLSGAIFGLAKGEAAASIAQQITVIIPTRDRIKLLSRTVDSLYKNSLHPPGETIIVDNGSQSSEAREWLNQASQVYPGLRVIRDDGGFNFSRLCNTAARSAQGDLLVFLNNDTVIKSPAWMELCGEMALQRDIGCVGPLLTYPDGRIQHAGIVTGVGGIAGHVWSGFRPDQVSSQFAPLVTRNVSGLTGACLFLAKRKFFSVGGFDEAHLGVAFNDLDLCLRLTEVGLRHVLVPWCQVVHHESMSRTADVYESKDGRFRAEFDWVRQRWGQTIDIDPFFPRPLRIDKSRPIPFWSYN